MSEPRFVTLAIENDMYEIRLMDAEHKPVGHGYRGPSKKRADLDLKYWVRTKGLSEVAVTAQPASPAE